MRRLSFFPKNGNGRNNILIIGIIMIFSLLISGEISGQEPCPDNDGDGYTDSACGGTDCNDLDPNVNPGEVELCNGVDDDCNGGVDYGCTCFETRITSDLDNQKSPAIYGDIIVWDDYRNLNHDIYMYDISTGIETQITTEGNYQINPSIYGDKIVWEDGRNGNEDIYMYDLSTGIETPISVRPSRQMEPVIFEDKIVWREFENFEWYLYFYNGTERLIDSGPEYYNLDIFGDIIVWDDRFNIYIYNLSTNIKTQITPDTSWQRGPAIYGDIIVYSDDRNDNSDIYMYNLSSGIETQITSDPSNQYRPDIYGDRIVWQEDYRSSYDIHMYDLSTGTERRITTNSYGQYNPAVYGDKIVYHDDRMGNFDIYMYDDQTDGFKDDDGDGYSDLFCLGTDCNDYDASINPGVSEITCDSINNDCNSQTLDNPDNDLDTFGVCDECNDTDPSINPGVPEFTCDGIDNDCNAGTSDLNDNDGDGFSCDVDCNDNDYSIFPGQIESCNGIDDNCDTQIDEGFSTTTYYLDSDSDNYGNPDISLDVCYIPENYVTDNSDCDDSNLLVHPDAMELCNGVDDNCDMQIDEGFSTTTYYLDSDSDNYGNPDISLEVCYIPENYVTDNSDCDDSNLLVHPGALESCNGVDDNCDMQIDEGVTTTFYEDYDSDTYGNPSVTQDTCSIPFGFVTDSTDCDDSDPNANPGEVEVTCDGKDNDCDALTLDNPDNDGDTYDYCSDCDDSDPNINPGATEVCNGIDDNCDTVIPPQEIIDFDVDGFMECQDCDDSDPNINPGATEICNGIDDDCDTIIPLQETIDFDIDGYMECQDCDDTNPAIFPGALEICGNGFDEDCNGFDQTCTGSTLYVDDAPGCEGNTPCYSSIQSAVDAASSGDTINVLAGTYSGPIFISKSINLIGAGASTTTITNPSNGNEVIWVQYTNGVTIMGFTVSGGYRGIFLDGSNDCIIRDNIVDSNFRDGICLWSSNNLLIENNIATNHGATGIFIGYGSNNVTLVGNTAQENGGYDIWLYPDYYTGCDFTFVNNVGSGGRPIEYLSGTQSLDGVILSELILCDADNSIINNVQIEGSSTLDNNGIISYFTDNAVYTNMVSSNNEVGYSSIWESGNTISNCQFNNNDGYGIYLSGSSGNTISNSNFNNNRNGLNIDGSSDNNLIFDNNVEYNSYWGVYLHYGIIGNTLINNYFNNDVDLIDSYGGFPHTNVWNSTNGGNYWAKPSGSGFSESCIDGNSDGICDSSYTLAIENVDYLPLANPPDPCDTDRDGYIDSACGGNDCNDIDPSVNPGAVEICNGQDDNCNGQVDDGLPKSYSYRDYDGDGYGDPLDSVYLCNIPDGYILENTDCDDTNPYTYPGAIEVCDGFDNNCPGDPGYGLVDENIVCDISPITNDPGNDWMPSLSYTSDKIVFVSDRTGTMEIWMMDPDGSNQVQITNDPSSFEYWPKFGPPALEQIAYVSCPQQAEPLEPPYCNCNVNKMYLNNGTIVTFISTGTVCEKSLAWGWTPGDSWIAYSRYIEDWMGGAEVFKIRPGGVYDTQLTYNDFIMDFPADFSADLSKLTFIRKDMGSPEYPIDLYTMNIDGTGVNRLTQNQGITNVGGGWSPDSSQIAFSSDRTGNQELFVMNSDGSGSQQLTFNPANDLGGGFFPDGSLYFVSDRSGNLDIWSYGLPPVECYDNDLDGFDTCGITNPNDTDGLPADCNDNDFNINPAAEEVCDGLDNDCDGLVDNVPDTETQITFDTSGQYQPAIYGDRIVYMDFRSGFDWDIYLYDLSTGMETQITADPSGQYLPAIYGDKIVWEDYRNGLSDIYMYDLSTGLETQITNDPSSQESPNIYGEKIVWGDTRNGNYDIYMYDLSTGMETQITTNPYNQMSPAIYGDIIVWDDNRDGNLDIYMYDLSTGTETWISTESMNQYRPDIYGDKIIWQDERNGNLDIYMHDIATRLESRITFDSSDQVEPSIYGDKIVWEDNRNGYPNLDIYMYDISTGIETQITTDPSSQSWPAIYGDRIVWPDERNGPANIYMYELGSCQASSSDADGDGIIDKYDPFPNDYEETPATYIIGDSWNYLSWDNMDPSCPQHTDWDVIQMSVTDITMLDGQQVYETGFYGNQVIVPYEYITVPGLNMMATIAKSCTNPMIYFDTSADMFNFPLWSGKTWSTSTTFEYGDPLNYGSITGDVWVVGQGTIDLSGISYETFKVNLTLLNQVIDRNSGVPVYSWYEFQELWLPMDNSVLGPVLLKTYDESGALTSYREYLPEPNTPVGQNVVVDLTDGTLTFDDVITAGMTTILPLGSGEVPLPPANFQLTGNQFDISSTAMFSGSILVCLNYDESGISDESALKLMHYESSSWMDVTTSLDINLNEICGSVTSLSPFAVMEETSSCTISFPDVPPSHWGYSYIDYLFCNGIVNGYPDGTFKPGNSITRGQFAKMIVNANGIPEYYPPTPTFSDVPSDHWAYGYVEAAVQAGIISGYTDGTFRPGNQVTRAQISAMIARSRGWTYSGGLEDFTDVPPTHWAYDNIMSMKEKGIIGGYPDSTFLPANQATRGQNSKMIANMMQTP